MSADVSLIDDDPRTCEVVIPPAKLDAAALALKNEVLQMEFHRLTNATEREKARVVLTHQKRYGSANGVAETLDYMDRVLADLEWGWRIESDPATGGARFFWEGGDGEGEIIALLHLFASYVLEDSEVRFMSEYGNMYGYQVHGRQIYPLVTEVLWKREQAPIAADLIDVGDEDEDEDEDEDKDEDEDEGKEGE